MSQGQLPIDGDRVHDLPQRSAIEDRCEDHFQPRKVTLWRIDTNQYRNSAAFSAVTNVWMRMPTVTEALGALAWE
jgi:hypothetical protein